MKLIIYKQHILIGEKKLSQDDVDYIKSIKLSKRKNDIMHTNYFEDFNDEKTISIIKKYEMFIDTSHNHKVILINIVYNNHKTTIDIINNKIKDNGYTVALEMKE